MRIKSLLFVLLFSNNIFAGEVALYTYVKALAALFSQGIALYMHSYSDLGFTEETVNKTFIDPCFIENSIIKEVENKRRLAKNDGFDIIFILSPHVSESDKNIYLEELGLKDVVWASTPEAYDLLYKNPFIDGDYVDLYSGTSYFKLTATGGALERINKVVKFGTVDSLYSNYISISDSFLPSHKVSFTTGVVHKHNSRNNKLLTHANLPSNIGTKVLAIARNDQGSVRAYLSGDPIVYVDFADKFDVNNLMFEAFLEDSEGEVKKRNSLPSFHIPSKP